MPFVYELKIVPQNFINFSCSFLYTTTFNFSIFSLLPSATNWCIMSNRKLRTPLSLAELKKKRQEEKDLQSKPVFLSEKAREETKNLEKDRKRQSNTTNNSRIGISRFANDDSEDDDDDEGNRLDNQEIRAIQRKYIGQVPDESQSRMKKKSLKPNDKIKFRFKWDASEDTMKNEDDFRKGIRRNTEQSLFGRSGTTQEQYQSSAFEISVGRNRKKHRPQEAALPASSSSQKRTRRNYDQRRWWEKERREMTQRDWRIFREDFMISVRGGHGVVNPGRNWEECDLPRGILDHVTSTYKKPTPIQMATIPVCISGRDVIGLAETGSGKTAAYVLPMLKHILALPKLTVETSQYGAYALVMAPTRELALQIEVETRKFADRLGFRVVSVIGGADMDTQANELQLGAEIIICTPGRMADLISRRLAALGNCNFLVLDEADRMIDMGFEPKVMEILDAMPEQNPDAEMKITEQDDSNGDTNSNGKHTSDGVSRKRQTLMFSATMVPAVERMARTYLMNPVIVTIGETGQVADNVEQKVEFYASDGKRRNRLVELLQTLEAPILVFCNTRSVCEVIGRFVNGVSGLSGVRCVVMHAGKSQDVRESSLLGFKNGRYQVMIATDVVGRGIDIKGVKNVINYEMPDDIDKYTHRIGRTGRAGMTGTAWSLCTAHDEELFPELRKVLEQGGQQVPREVARFNAADSVKAARGGAVTYGKAIID